MFAANRNGVQKRASFQTAGGNILELSHPYLAGQVDTRGLYGGSGVLKSAVNTVNVSRSLKLDSRYLEANPIMPNARMVVLVDGSTITITNDVLAGELSIQVVPTTGLVRDGDMTIIAPTIMSMKDRVGGVFIVRRFVSAGTLTRVYHGITFSDFPHQILEGNDVPVYPIRMLYTGWFEGLHIAGSDEKTTLWAVGNQRGYEGSYLPFKVNTGDSDGILSEIDNRDENGQFDNFPDGVSVEDVSVLGGLQEDLTERGVSTGTPA